jgi:hypothetical protein
MNSLNVWGIGLSAHAGDGPSRTRYVGYAALRVSGRVSPRIAEEVRHMAPISRQSSTAVPNAAGTPNAPKSTPPMTLPSGYPALLNAPRAPNVCPRI